ncbi:MAG: tRNA lysidine(34) synthetase TilS [Muribaculaceae bacterium]
MDKLQFEEKVKEFMARECHVDLGDCLLVTVSGGADSVALLWVLHSLGYQCQVAHCNFHLRGEESNRDEQWVRQLAQRLDVPVHVEHFDVAAYESSHGVSTEMACRELRYEWFEQLRRSLGCQAIAVAHHADDAVETFFLNAVRGSGVRGLASIKPRNGYLVRPLLCVDRGLIEDYLTQLQVEFVIDSTNEMNVYKRNKVRNQVLPLLYDCLPEAKIGLQRTLQNVREQWQLYEHLVEQARAQMMHCSGGVWHISKQALLAVPQQEAMLHELLKQFGFNSSQVHSIALGLNNVGSLYFSASHRLVVERDGLDVSALGDDACCEVPVGFDDDINSVIKVRVERVPMPFVRGSVDGQTTVAIGKSVLAARKVVLRHWRQGDRMRPFGLKGSKLLSDVFADFKANDHSKRNAWVLEADGTIVWLLGYRSSRDFPIKAADDFYLKLTYEKDTQN